MSEQSVASARAAVLIYDSNLKKWMPSGSSSGLSKVHIYHHVENNTFRVVGRKVQDHEVVLNCSILKGFKYFQATPLFHQWRDKHSQVFGLNFHSRDDAETFALAMERVIDILGHSSNRSSHAQPLYQTIGHSGVSIDDYAEYRGWANNENGDKKSNTSDYSSGSEYGHYRSSQGNHSSHPTTPGSIPSPSSYSHHRTSSAPSVSQQPLAVASPQPSPQSSVPPPPPPPPPANSSISGLATMPRLHLRPSGEQEMTETSLAAAIASAKLKKTIPKASEVVANEKPAALKAALPCLMDEMTRTLARRRAQTENSLDVDSISSGDSNRSWKNSSNAFSPNRNSGEDSPQSLFRSEVESENKGQIVVDMFEMEKMKQEILTEMRTAVNKMKQDIIDAIRMELNRR
ncbi:ena/VASP-like protein isoform X2 [Parasteatoda tepidariorum]|uniref:ena/VASP-like protein isoform X2 n=1 Tax=Parasteatoda tepidariorum TaxID=114398 RepID=UPI00077F9030|nr:ena/VASP-like protein isoform X2 [Parasteatoda tepidariorum]